MRKPTKSEKEGLRKLRRAGLYEAKNPRKAPTRRAFMALEKFASYLNGHAVIKNVGTRKNARQLINDLQSEQVIGAGKRIVVNKESYEKIGYSKKTGKLKAIIKTKNGEQYVREFIRFKGVPSVEKLRDMMRPGDMIAVSVRRRGGRIASQRMSFDEFQKFYFQYGPASQRQYKNLLANIQIARYIEADGTVAT